VLSRDFRFAGGVIRTEGHRDAVEWLEEFVAPQFAVVSAVQPDYTVRFLVGASEHARLAAGGPDPEGRTRPCFTLDSSIVTARVWRAPADDELAFDEARAIFFRRRSAEPRVAEVIVARDTGPARVALMRVVREYAMGYASRRGWLIVHAAAVRLGRAAVVIAGPKHAGKTTLLLHALAHERGVYIANDRVALHLGPAGITVHGIPAVVSVRHESLAWFPGMAAALEEFRPDRHLTLAERRAGREPGRMPAGRWCLSPAQLCRVLGVDSAPSAPVDALVFPRIHASQDVTRLETLAPDQAAAALRAAVLRSSPPDGMFRIDGSGSDGAALRRPALPRSLPSQVATLDCRLAPNAYQAGADWLRALSLDGSSTSLSEAAPRANRPAHAPGAR
jgi:hypothetical protein